MVKFTTPIYKFERKGEKTGWTYIEIPADAAQQLKQGNKKSFRVKGKLDIHEINKIALLPMGGGNFIMPLNAAMRKKIGKRHGAMLSVQLEEDKAPFKLDHDFMECLSDDPAAVSFFNSLAKSHQHYFSKWIQTSKTETTKAKRIAKAVTALSRKLDFGSMLRMSKGNG